MIRLKVYIETSVWNFLFADDAPDKKDVTERFFHENEICKYELYISETVLAEIQDAPPEKFGLLMRAVEKYSPEILERSDEVTAIADAYLEHGLLSEKHIRDIYHVAYTTVNGLDIILTWNMKHLVKRKTQHIVEATNRILGYRGIEIRTPGEMMEDED